jgi:sulfoxide reductase heme-binding subunit YedZ
VARLLLFLASLAPAVSLIVRGLMGRLTANPIDEITDVTGTWTLRFVLITLAVTPLRRLTGWNVVIRYRRMLGLFAFFYGSLHFLTWIGLDQGFGWAYIGADIADRPFITAGFLGFVLMVPLALTSTAGWIRRLGGRRWAMLHRLIYVTAIAGVVHFWWLVKVIELEQQIYAAILTVLLGIRIWFAASKRLGAARQGRLVRRGAPETSAR